MIPRNTVDRTRRTVPLRLLAALAALLAAAPIAAAGEVAVLLSADVDAYREALRGFEGALGRPLGETFDMRGDVERGVRLLAEIEEERHPDLIFAVGLWALQAVLRRPPRSPVVYAMVLNPPSVMGTRPPNVAGASMNVPVSETIRVLKAFGPRVRRVGVVYNEDKTGYLVARAKTLAAKEGIELLDRSVNSPKQAIRALDSLQAEGIDAFWYVPDETILASAVTKHVFLVSHRSGIPVLGLSERQAEMGALMALSFASSEDIGRQAGEMGRAILGGRRPSDIPFTSARQVALTVNLKTARKLGIEVPESILVAANDVIE